MDKQFIDAVRYMTQNNNHGEARERIANHYGYCGDFAEMFMNINRIHAIQGSLDNNLSLFRSKITDEMLKRIEKIDGIDEANEIASAL
jgi:hypothetical protein